MKRALVWFVSLLIVLLIQHVSSDFGSDFEMQEMTHIVDNKTLVWPGSVPFETFNLRATNSFFDNDSWVEANTFCTSERAGTHLNSPYMFNPRGPSVGAIPLSSLVSRAVIINITEKASKNPDSQVTLEDVWAWETKYGRIPDGAIVLMNSGWHKKYPNREQVFSTRDSDSSKFHYPGFHPAAVEWLLLNRSQINGLGVDTPSIDYGQSKDNSGQRKLASFNKYGLAYVANIDGVPENGIATLYSLPYKLRNGFGAPVHIIAVWPKDGNKRDDSSTYADLTQPFDADSVTWGVDPPFKETELRADSSSGYWFGYRAFCASEDCGTHMDAPRHFTKGGTTIGQLPVTRHAGPAVVIDISKRAEKDSDAMLEVSDLVAWETRNGRIPDGAIVIMNSGWYRRYPNRTALFGSFVFDYSLFHYPGFSANASKWLLDNRPLINAIGVDTPSLDPGRVSEAWTHRWLLPKNIFGMEHLTNLHLLPEKGATLIVLPFRLFNGACAPAYVIAKFPSSLAPPPLISLPPPSATTSPPPKTNSTSQPFSYCKSVVTLIIGLLLSLLIL